MTDAACNCPASYDSAPQLKASVDRGHDDTCPQSGSMLSSMLAPAADRLQKLVRKTMMGRSEAEWYATAVLRTTIPLIAAAERERIRKLAIAEAERQETANFSTIDTICGATLRDFAESLGEFLNA